MKRKKITLILIVVLILLSMFGLKNYSDSLRKDGQGELSETKNRKVAIEKIRLAQTVWPFLRFDKPYQNLLSQLNAIESRSAVNIFLNVNTSIEDMTDLITTEHKQEAKTAKDVAAGMVLVTSIGAAVVGAYIFLPYILNFI